MSVSKVFVLAGIICFLLAAFSVALGPFPPLGFIGLGLFFVHLPSLIA